VDIKNIRNRKTASALDGVCAGLAHSMKFRRKPVKNFTENNQSPTLQLSSPARMQPSLTLPPVTVTHRTIQFQYHCHPHFIHNAMNKVRDLCIS
jgi:hypothetical protein